MRRCVLRRQEKQGGLGETVEERWRAIGTSKNVSCQNESTLSSWEVRTVLHLIHGMLLGYIERAPHYRVGTIDDRQSAWASLV